MDAWRILALPNRNKVTSPSRWNRSKLAGLCLAALLNTLWASPLLAQSNGVAAATSAQPTHTTHRRASLDSRVKAFAAALKLNEAQQEAVKRVLELRQQETLRLRRDPSISGSVRIERFRALQDQTVERIRAVLNDEQKTKYDPLVVRRAGPAPEQRSVEDWLKITNPQ